MLRGAISALTVEGANEILLKLFGPGSEAYAQAAYVKDGCLGIKISASAAASEIRLNETRILNEIKAKFGEKSVKKIRFLL